MAASIQVRGLSMTIVKWLGGIALIAVIALLVAAQLGLFRGRAPGDLGVHDGKLKRPSKTPNSVTSQAALHPEHPMRNQAQIAPLALRGDGPATIERLRALVAQMPGATVVHSEPDYLYVQFETRLMRYVDDAEFWFDPKAGVVQVRSASRLGAKDFGVNRARIEAIRAKLAAG
jgi:uncharacterized protein (DUF1499 family)